MTDRIRRERKVSTGFVGIQLTEDLLQQLDMKVASTTLNRSQIIRLALIEYLKEN